MTTLGISIIAHNEEGQIADAIISARFASEIVVIDCESTDDTLNVVRGFPNVKIFSRPNNSNLNRNKTYGFEQLTTDWIFYLDPDERISPTLAGDIQKKISSEQFVAYKIPRRNHFFGKWLEYGGQYPDYQVRLFKRGYAAFPHRHVHESLEVKGAVGTIKEPFDHHPYPNLSTYLRKMDFYTSFQADYWQGEGAQPAPASAIRYMFSRPLLRFLRRFLIKQGFRDGWQGYIAAIGDAFQSAISYAKLIERTRKIK